MSSSWACYLVFKDRAVLLSLADARDGPAKEGRFRPASRLPPTPSRPSRLSSGARLLTCRTVSRQPLCFAANFPPAALRASALFGGARHLPHRRASCQPLLFRPLFPTPACCSGRPSSGRGAASTSLPSCSSTLFFGADFRAPAAPACRLSAQWAGSNFPPPSRQPLFARPFLPASPEVSLVVRSLLQLDSGCQGTLAGVLPGRPPREGGRLVRPDSGRVNNSFRRSDPEGSVRPEL